MPRALVEGAARKRHRAVLSSKKSGAVASGLQSSLVEGAVSLKTTIVERGAAQKLAKTTRVEKLVLRAWISTKTSRIKSNLCHDLGRRRTREALVVARPAASQAGRVTEVGPGTRLNYGRAGSGRGVL